MAGINIIDAGATDRAVSSFHAIDAGGTDRTITQGRVIGPDGVDRVFWDPSGTVSFAVTATTPVGGHSFGTGVATTHNSTAVATGGTGPYTYSWSLISYTNSTPPTINASSSATTAFTQTNLSPNETDTATFRVTAHDSTTPANTATFDVTAIWTDIS